MIARLLLAALGGAGLWLSFPTIGWWPLAILGVALISLATYQARMRVAALVGLVSGLACFAPTLHWTGIYVGNFPWIALSVTEALYFVPFAMACALVQHRSVRPATVAVLWVVQELVRSSVPFGGFSWARLAFSQSQSPLLHFASVAGAPGVTFVVALLGGFLAVAVAAAAGRFRGRPLRAVPAVASLIAAGLVLLVAQVYPVPTSGKPLQVMGIQGNVPTAGLEFNAQRRAVLDNHVKLTERAATEVKAGTLPRPQLVVWPENSSDIDPTRNADAATEITRVVSAIDSPLIVGAVLQQPSPKVSNASLLYAPGRGIVATYVKQHPVPFAEYIPYRSFFRKISKQVDLVRADFVQGDKVGLFDVQTPDQGTVKVGPVICFEVAYDGLVRAPVNRGAQLLVVQTNNATFGYTAESEQQLAISQFRAVETGRSIVHVSTVGVSALITPDGVAHERTKLFTPAILSGQLPLRTTLTLADRLGNGPEWLASGFAILAVCIGWRHRRRTRRAAAHQTREQDHLV